MVSEAKRLATLMKMMSNELVWTEVLPSNRQGNTLCTNCGTVAQNPLISWHKNVQSIFNSSDMSLTYQKAYSNNYLPIIQASLF
jgi:hypothetical protein